MLTPQQIADLSKAQILDRLSIYSYPRLNEQFSHKIPNWRLVLTLLLDKKNSSFIEFTGPISDGRFVIKDRRNFINAVRKLTGGERELREKDINSSLESHKERKNLEYHEGVFRFKKWVMLVNQMVVHNQ